jgi:hypothetical protein
MLVMLSLSHLALLVPLVVLGEGPVRTGKIDFNRDVRPILSDNCFACHGLDAKSRKGDLRLDVRAEAVKTEAIVPGKAEASELVRRLLTDEPRKVMPPPKTKKKLTPAQIATLRAWIDQGAPYAEHWAFVPPVRPSLPRVSTPQWSRTPVDHFVLARLDAERLRPRDAADRAALLRRVTFDLTGLPPTLAELDAFLADTRPDAYERVVDRLLASPRFGEHQARFWLDLARFGDTHGLHLDNYREMWLYRDWVIAALNANMPYDRFAREQLAGDQLPASGPAADKAAEQAALIATGFNRAHVTTSEGGSITEEVHIRNVNDRVDTFGGVFLGLSVGCAKCHDHKYDPLTQKDFYALSAYFNSLEGNPLDGNAARHPPVLRVPTPEQSKRLAEIESTLAAAKKDLTAKAAALKFDEAADAKGPGTFADWNEKLRSAGQPPEIAALAKVPLAKRKPEQLAKLRTYFIEHVWAKGKETLAPLRATVTRLEAERAALDAAIPATYVFKDAAKPRQAYILKRGEYDQRGEPVGRDIPAFLGRKGEVKTRLDLARWVLDEANPLPARVAVNRLWQQVFGVGLVKTSEEFGVQGELPSHPELLDWLAVEFRASGWDVKYLLRLMVTSATYRQSAALTPELVKRDPENRLLARGPRHRLDAEMIRDQALALSGLMVEQIGGPSVKPPQPPGLWKAVAYPTSTTANFVPDRGEKVFRRGLYTFWKRTAPPPQMTTFDAPSRESCIARRERTNTPLQALLLLNDPQYLEASRVLAQHTLKAQGDDAERLAWLFRQATSRLPREAERRELQAALTELRGEFKATPAAAKKLLSGGETPVDASIAPEELAAWTLLASTVLNLDEVLNK